MKTGISFSKSTFDSNELSEYLLQKNPALNFTKLPKKQPHPQSPLKNELKSAETIKEYVSNEQGSYYYLRSIKLDHDFIFNLDDSPTDHQNQIFAIELLIELYTSNKKIEQANKKQETIRKQFDRKIKIMEESHYELLADIDSNNRLIQDQQESYSNRLQEEIELQTRELTLAKKKAEDASTAKTRFLAMMSHEIRTPMNAIIGFSDILIESNLTESQHENADIIVKSGQALLNIIDDILDFSKIEAGQMNINATSLSIEQIINDACNLVTPRLNAGTVITHEVDTSIPQLLGDAGKISQILINLIGNSCKFTEKGTIHVTAEIEEDFGDKVKILVAISDTGIGIAKDKLNHIFSPFKQADSSTTRKYGGTGLGLAICKQLTELMGGEIWATNNSQNGTTFSFTAILEKSTEMATQESKVAEPKVKPTITTGFNILVAEDHPVNQKLITIILKKLGYESNIATNGEEACNLFFKEPSKYAAILMDMQMPIMDGISATEEIRKKGYKIPIIAMTANVLQEDQENCKKAGMDDFVAKPVKSPILEKTLDRIILKKDQNA